MNLVTKTELFNRKQLLIVPVGISMKPLFKDSCTPVLVEYFDKKPKVNDIVLYVKNDGRLVLHRVIALKKNGCITRGDGCVTGTMFIPYENIFGICRGYYKGDKFIDCRNNFCYKLYLVFWKSVYPFRYLGKLIQKIIKSKPH